MWQKLFYIALAGAGGTLLRYWLAGVVQRNVNSDFPFGTLVVNLAGCLLFGVVWAMLETRLSISGQVRTAILVGFFGAFTTFSSFIFETSQLMDESQWLWTSANILLQNTVGIMSMLAGLAVGKMI